MTQPQNQNPSPLHTLLADHLDLVYSAALRQTRNPHLAEDVTQTVFLLAAKKHRSIPPHHTAAWLINATRYTTLATLRAHRRRARHEHRAATEIPPMSHEPPDPDLPNHLDAALAALSPTDRELLIRRYFQNHPIADIAAALHLSDNTLSKRLARALEKLRTQLTRKGITTPAATLTATLISTAIRPAPKSLAAHILSNATLAPAIPIGVLLMTATTSLKLTLAVVLLALLLIPTTYMLLPRTSHRIPSSIPIAAAGTSPSPPLSANFLPFKNNAPIPAEAEIVATTIDRRTWWSPDGTPLPRPLTGADFSSLHDPYNEKRTTYQFAVRLANLPTSAGTVYLCASGHPRILFNAPLQPDPHDPTLFYGAALLYPETKTTDLLLHFSSQPWEKLLFDPNEAFPTPAGRITNQLFRMITVNPNTIQDINGNTAIRLGLEPWGDYEYSALAIAKDGSSHPATDAFIGPITNCDPIWSFDIPLRDVQHFGISIRLLDCYVRFQQLSLAPDQPTAPYSNPNDTPIKHFDNNFYNLQYEIVHQLQLNNLTAAAAVADTLLTQATERRAKLTAIPDLYLIDKGLPLITQLHDALHANDPTTANKILDSSTGTGFRLQAALQAIAENPPR